MLDFSPVSFVDSTSVQALVDARNQLARHASPETVEWHFANINDRWTKRALVANGFGYPLEDGDQAENVTLNIAALSPDSKSPRNEKADLENANEITPLETLRSSGSDVVSAGNLYGANWPYFHPDLRTAVKNAVDNAVRKNKAGSL